MAAVLTHTSGASPEDVLARLSQVDVLRALPPEEILDVVGSVRRLDVPRGTRVITQGEIGDALYFIESGKARVTHNGSIELGVKGPGDVFGEMALLTGETRTATVTADTDLVLWRVPRDDFERVVAASPRLRATLEDIAARHRAGQEVARGDAQARRLWRARGLRALAARARGWTAWQLVMVGGFTLYALLALNERLEVLALPELTIAGLQLLCGLAVIQGACEAFLLAVERTGARLKWDGFVSGTAGSLVATLPEFVVIAFLVAVEPLAAFVTAAVTIYNNALAFSVYSFFLPKDQRGQFVMPHSLAKAGGEVLVAGSGIAMIVGVLMLGLEGRSSKTSLGPSDLAVIGIVLLAIYGYYTYTLVRYYAESESTETAERPPDPDELGHDRSWRGIGLMFGAGIAASYVGGEAIGSFANTALNQLGLPTIPTAAMLAFFAGISEYIIVWKAHRRGELGIALSNAFGGMTQVMFLLLPFAMLTIAIFGAVTGAPIYVVPIELQTMLLILLLFPVFYVLLEFLKDDHTLNNLDAAAMTGIYLLLLYFLFTAGG